MKREHRMMFYVAVARSPRRNYAADEQFYFPFANRCHAKGWLEIRTWEARGQERGCRSCLWDGTTLGTGKQIKFANRMKGGWFLMPNTESPSLSFSPSLRRIIGRVPWKFFCRQILKVLTTKFSSRFENYDIGAWSTIHRKLDQPIVLKPVREALKLSVTSSNWIYRFDGSVSVAAAKVRANF